MTTLAARQPTPAMSATRPAWRRAITPAAIALVLVVGLALSLALGAVRIPLAEVWAVITGSGEGTTKTIIMSARLPRALVALLAGANLAVAGVLLQGVTRNPLADPGIIGVTAGAGMAATIVLAAFPQAAHALPLAAFLGAMASAIFVYAVSWTPGSAGKGGTSPVRMVLAGVAVNAILGAVIGVLITAFADRIPAVMFWTAGSFNGRGWSHLWQVLPYSIVGLTIAYILRSRVRILELGDDTASTMGISVERTRLLAFAAAALLAGSAASVAGLVGFVGLVVPHLVRLAMGSNRLIVPVSAFAGGALLLWADLAARTVLAPSELPVGVVTGLVGGPYFIFLLYKSGWLR
ncbi:MAG: FecCD family ABC transporter permease [Phycisphaerales bacterium JB064]